MDVGDRVMSGTITEGTEYTEVIKVKKNNENLWGLPQSEIAIIEMNTHYTETRSLAAELFISHYFL